MGGPIERKIWIVTDLEQIDAILEKELGTKFAKVLGDAGVFKDNDASERFIKTINKRRPIK